MEQASPFPDFVVEDLALSGLEIADIEAKLLGPSEKAATNTPLGVDGYVIPYYDIKGKRVPFYRVKLINHDPKYKQVADSNNYIYFPPRLPELLNKAKFILLTEGEKKAAAAVKAGIPAVAVSGVDSWRNRTFIIPGDAKLGQDKQSRTVVKVSQGTNIEERFSTFADGFFDLINWAQAKEVPIIIVYDSDIPKATNFNQAPKAYIKYEVQRAAATLAFELRAKGLKQDNIRQLVLDPRTVDTEGKIGLDDWLTHKELGPEKLREEIYKVLVKRSAFPLHPNPKQFVQKKLQRQKLSRDEMHGLSIAVLSDLDAKGIRLYDKNSGSFFYFDEAKHKLYPVEFGDKIPFSQTPFGVKLYQDYTLTSGDGRLIQHLAAQFAGEPTVKEVYPERVVCTRNDTMYYQLNDGQMVKVDANNIQIVSNGTDDILFEASRTEPLRATQMEEALNEVKDQPLASWWYEVLKVSRLPDDETRRLVALLFSISPWFYRWRRTQLPIEMTIGEPGTGKSTLYELRQMILEGRSNLRNAPNDLKDWAASVSVTGGMHVTDNLHMMNPKLHQELSDELCRIITSSDPFIEQRKYYTNAETLRIPVKSTFAVTAVIQPFKNKDIIQRAVIVKLDKGTEEVTFDSNWMENQLSRFGGRSRWLAHQFIFQQAMFRRIAKQWDYKHQAKYRLINVEQLLMLAAETFGWESAWIPEFLNRTKQVEIRETDWALDGLKDFSEYWFGACGPKKFTTKNVVDWAMGEEDYEKCTILNNTRSLGKYISSNKNTIAEITGLEPAGTQNNRQLYIIKPRDNVEHLPVSIANTQ